MKKLVFLLSVMILTACATAQTKYNIVVQKTAPQLYLQGTGAQTRFYNTTLTESSGTLTLAGGNLNLGTNSLLGTGSIGATGAGKLTKVWAVDGEFTNPITINGTSIATTYAPIIAPTFVTGVTTPTLTLGSTLLTATGNQLNYLNTSTSDIQTQLNAKEASLGNPTVDGYVLSSTIAGVRSWVVQSGGGGGGGSVTNVAVTTANGVSAVVTNPTSTPDMTFTLGAITPTSVNGIAFTGASTPTLTVTGTSSISGVNTGNNAVNTLYSGLVTNATHTGDVTGATALTIANSAVTLAKMANVATATVFYRKSGGTGVPQVQTLATLKTDLGLTGTNSGDQTNITGNAGTATTLYTARTINGVSFNGSANISVPSNITPGTDGNVMTSNGSVWTSETPPDTVSLVEIPLDFNYQTVGYTLVLTDVGKLIVMDSGSGISLTIPPNSSVAFAIGQKITVTSIGAGVITIAGGSGVSIRSLSSMTKIAGQYGVVTLIKIAENSWLVYGDLSS